MFLGTLCFEFSARTDAGCILRRQRGDCNRNERVPLHRDQFYFYGHFPDLSGLFPGNRICREEFGTDDRENRVVFCAAGIYFFKIRFAVFLADFPGNRAAYLCDRSRIL